MASPPGAVPPPADGEPDLPPGIAPPPELGVSANAAAPDLSAANVADWAGSADAHAAAWAAYQQQYAYQHTGADWGAYHTVWAHEWARHNEVAAAAAAAPSAERLAAVAAKIAEQIAEAEKTETRFVAPAAATADATTRPAGPSGVHPADDDAKPSMETNPRETDRQASPPPPPPPPPAASPPPASSLPPPPPPPLDGAVRRGNGDEGKAKSARAEPRPRDRAGTADPDPSGTDRKRPPALIPRQIQPPSAPARGVEPSRARDAGAKTAWRAVAADALEGGEKGAVAAEKARLAREIETSRARLFPAETESEGARVPDARNTSARRDGDGAAIEVSRGGGDDDHRGRRRRDDEEAFDARRMRRRRVTKRPGPRKDVAYWERHYAAKHGIPLDGGFESSSVFVSDADRGAEKEKKPSGDAASREGSSAATTATGLPEADERARAETDDGARNKSARADFQSRETTRRRLSARGVPGSPRETRRDAFRGDARGDVARERLAAAGRFQRRRLPLTAARASRAWGPNGTPPDSPEPSVEEDAPVPVSAAAEPRDARDEPAERRRPNADANANEAEARTRSRRGVVVLRGVTTREELMDPAEAEEIEKETALECEAFGEVRDVRVVRPNPLGPAFDPEDVGVVYLRFANDDAADAARKSLHGRTFADRPVTAERGAT